MRSLSSCGWLFSDKTLHPGNPLPFGDMRSFWPNDMLSMICAEEEQARSNESKDWLSMDRMIAVRFRMLECLDQWLLKNTH